MCVSTCYSSLVPANSLSVSQAHELIIIYDYSLQLCHPSILCSGRTYSPRSRAAVNWKMVRVCWCLCRFIRSLPILHANLGGFATAVQKQYGGLEKLKSSLNAAAMSIQGSGWAWLVRRLPHPQARWWSKFNHDIKYFQAYNQKEKTLAITTTGNQDPLTAPLVPIIGIDMW